MFGLLLDVAIFPSSTEDWLSLIIWIVAGVIIICLAAVIIVALVKRARKTVQNGDYNPVRFERKPNEPCSQSNEPDKTDGSASLDASDTICEFNEETDRLPEDLPADKND